VKKKVKNLLTITSIVVFSVIAVASNDNKSNAGKLEDIGSGERVSICRSCGLVVEGSNDILFPDNKKIKESCNNLIEGHLWYNAGRKGYNTFKCNNCGVEISIEETEPRCLTFCEIACKEKAKHDWRNTTTN
jgi:hypothetical protein